MVKVVLWGSLKTFTGGEESVEVEAANVRELLTRLGDAYPGLKPQIDRGLSVSIDGKIYRDAWFQPISPTSEVYLLPRLAGG
jgi:molybdopterin converting factor small subunit